jgi:hypothetical protein
MNCTLQLELNYIKIYNWKELKCPSKYNSIEIFLNDAINVEVKWKIEEKKSFDIMIPHRYYARKFQYFRTQLVE